MQHLFLSPSICLCKSFLFSIGAIPRPSLVLCRQTPKKGLSRGSPGPPFIGADNLSPSHTFPQPFNIFRTASHSFPHYHTRRALVAALLTNFPECLGGRRGKEGCFLPPLDQGPEQLGSWKEGAQKGRRGALSSEFPLALSEAHGAY